MKGSVSMLSITKVQADKLIEHSLKGYPNEVCGILAGKDGRVEKVYQMSNADESSKTFLMDPEEQFRVMKDMRSRSFDMVGIYHSHPETEAYPSVHDVRFAFYPETSYLIVSLKDEDCPDIKSFKITDGKIKNEKLIIK